MSALIAPMLELINNNESVEEKMVEAARIFFTSDTITVNLLPALLAAGLIALLAIPLLALLFQPAAESGGSGYGAPTYGAPEASYGAPEASYAAPESSYAAPSSGYGRADDGYGEFRSLSDSLLDSTAPQFELTKRMQNLAGPALSQLGEAAAKLIQ